MKFSICIPNYNYDQYIGETIQSVLDQDYGNFEIIIADNQSTDRSWGVIQEFAAKDNRVRAFQNAANLGFAGLRLAFAGGHDKSSEAFALALQHDPANKKNRLRKFIALMVRLLVKRREAVLDA